MTSFFARRELNGFGNSKLQALVRIFSGALFEEITPEYYNLHGSGTNIISLARFDTDKRRASARSTGRWAETQNGATAWARISAMRTGRCKLLSPGPALSWARRNFAVRAWRRDQALCWSALELVNRA